jgi:hypothetical protein
MAMTAECQNLKKNNTILLKAVDIISKEEGHVCPTNTLTNKQTKNIQI